MVPRTDAGEPAGPSQEPRLSSLPLIEGDGTFSAFCDTRWSSLWKLPCQPACWCKPFLETFWVQTDPQDGSWILTCGLTLATFLDISPIWTRRPPQAADGLAVVTMGFGSKNRWFYAGSLYKLEHISLASLSFSFLMYHVEKLAIPSGFRKDF